MHNISCFAERTNIPLFYQVHLGSRDDEISGQKTRVLPMTKLCGILGV